MTRERPLGSTSPSTGTRRKLEARKASRVGSAGATSTPSTGDRKAEAIGPRGAGTALAVVAAAGLASALTSGCATVAPYERERLAARDMALGGPPELGRAEGHATEVREGAAGGLGGAGGGCGCN
jgi:hypothetical protein